MGWDMDHSQSAGIRLEGLLHVHFGGRVIWREKVGEMQCERHKLGVCPRQETQSDC